MPSRRQLLGAALAAPFAATSVATSPARADTYPSKPIRVILPGPVGGLIDIGGRAVGDALQKDLGQPWLIDPRPGANGILAVSLAVARVRRCGWGWGWGWVNGGWGCGCGRRWVA